MNLIYNQNFGDYSLDFMLNFLVQKEKFEYIYLYGMNFFNDNVMIINVVVIIKGCSYGQEVVMVLFLGCVMYFYGNRYLFIVFLRRDGFLCFVKNIRWGWFLFFLVGWNISKEVFYLENVLVNNLKLCVSYGIIGNVNILYYGGIFVLVFNNYILGNGIFQGFVLGNFFNQDFFWESILIVNFGVDFFLFDSKLSIVIDVYQFEICDLFFNVIVFVIFGFIFVLQNIGKI